MKLWGGRFTKETNQLVHNFNESISFDQKLYKQDIAGSIAHVTMLAKQGKMWIRDSPDGACLQLGIGGMPNAVGSLIAESDLKDLGVHTEMYVEAFVDIAKAGKITGARKNIDLSLIHI